jgi:hypothetical protein
MSGGGSESASPQANGATGRGQLGGQTGGEAGIRCSTDAEIDPLDFTAKSPLGYSAADILQGLAPNYSASFSYADGSTSALAISLASDAGGAGYAPGCQRNAVDVVVGWSSTDGAFAETLHGKLFARSPDSATLSVELPAADFSGSYPRTHRAELMPAPVSFSFEMEFDPTSVHGGVSLLRGPLDAQDSLAIGSF